MINDRDLGQTLHVTDVMWTKSDNTNNNTEKNDEILDWDLLPEIWSFVNLFLSCHRQFCGKMSEIESSDDHNIKYFDWSTFWG